MPGRSDSSAWKENGYRERQDTVLGKLVDFEPDSRLMADKMVQRETSLLEPDDKRLVIQISGYLTIGSGQLESFLHGSGYPVIYIVLEENILMQMQL